MPMCARAARLSVPSTRQFLCSRACPPSSRRPIINPRFSSSLPTPSSASAPSHSSPAPEQQLPRTIASLLHPGSAANTTTTTTTTTTTSTSTVTTSTTDARSDQPDIGIDVGTGTGTGTGNGIGADSTNVTVHGWIKSVRRMGKVSFASVTDGTTSTPLQAVLAKPQVAGLSTGSSVRISGEWKQSRSGTVQQNELVAADVQLLGGADPATYPLQKKYQTTEYLRTLPHLRPRIPFNAAVLQLRSFMSQTLTSFFAENEFVQCYPPIITSSDCEGAGEVFTVSSNEKGNGHFFRTPKYLTVSSQLHLEALAAALPRVWTLSPTFRAEKSDTSRHLSEFYMLEAELSFIETLDPLLNVTEDMIRRLVSALKTSRIGQDILALSGDMMPELEARWEGLVQPGGWKRLTYLSAIEVLQAAEEQGKVEFQFPARWGESLQSEHEKYLAGRYGPVFVTDYPREIKPFYMLPSHGDARTVACFDLLFPVVGELIGGSLREHRYEELVQNMRSHGLISGDGDAGIEQSGLRWYTDLRKYGSSPHGGFGMGMDRLICYLSGVGNIRDVVAFPRWVGRCDA
ncbi:hypothetical protein BZA05DRAFT_385981 [Tricharina praecox]|uniref:uncharacterized protein n=1 Tax=Tricharina praecox TaxID=43433 RepID=UPI00221EAFF3|nr:uncharacterized protein BZA05DRAFT_385981 [Tricharina praecox]KAI5858113.1 hypothetical protein BZA05DRAFT_385981 [Tricharina praecox]